MGAPKEVTGDARVRLDPEALLADYERLRADALTGAANGYRWAHALLARSGMGAWITTWGEHAAAASVRRLGDGERGAAPAAPPDTKLLVSSLTLMLLACTADASPVAVAP